MVYAYYTDLQEQEYLQCLEHHAMLGFQNFDFLLNCAITEDDILILFSQPSAEESKQLNRISWFRVLAHVGIRYEAQFFDASTFLERIEDALTAVSLRRKQRYLELHEGASAEELAYLQRISGIEMMAPKTNFTELPERGNAPGRLTVFLGSDQDFLSYFQQNKSASLWIDGDLLRPSFDELFRIRSISTKIETHLTGGDNTGLNVLLDAVAKGIFHPELFRRVTRRVGLRKDILLGNYNIYNYEYYTEGMVLKLIEGALSVYDKVIWKAQPFPYDRISLAAMHRADRIVIALPSDSASIRYWHRLYRIYTEKQGISADRIVVTTRVPRMRNLLLPYLFGKSYQPWIRSVFRRMKWA